MGRRACPGVRADRGRGATVLDEAEVEDMAMHAGDIGIDMEAVDVLISKWPPGASNVGLPIG